MKKITLFIGMLVVGSLLFAQRDAEPKLRKFKMMDALQNDEQKTTTRTNRAPGDIIFEEYFDSTEWHTSSPENMPAGWSVMDIDGNNWFWRWANHGPRGPYVSVKNTSIPQWWTIPNDAHRIRSTSDTEEGGERGFMMIELDFYNSTSEGAGTSFPINSYVQLPIIEATENPAVNIRFEQYHRYCCYQYSATNGPKMLVSIDNVNWIQYDVHMASVGKVTANPSLYIASISDIAAYQSTIYIRFYTKGLEAYFWLIDDIMVYEPASYDINLKNYWVDYNSQKIGHYNLSYYEKAFIGTPFYNAYYAFQKITTSRAIVTNYGAETFNDVMITTNILKDDETVLNQQTSAVVSGIIPGKSDTTFVATHNFQIPKTLESIGSYYYAGVASGLQEDGMPDDNVYRYNFNITENIFGYANPLTAYTDVESPFTWVGAVDGDGVGIIFFLDPPTGNIPGTDIPKPYVLKGTNIYISGTSRNFDLWRSGMPAYLTAQVFEADPTTGDFNMSAPIIGSNAIPIDSSMANAWVHLPFILDGASENITPEVDGQEYLVLISFTTGNQSFYIGADKVTQPSWYSNFLHMGNDLSGVTTYSNISMEVIIDMYGESPKGEVKVTVLQKKIGTEETRPLCGSPVHIQVPVIDEGGELTGLELVELTTNSEGAATLDNLNSGSYTTYATLITQGGAIAVDNEGNPIRKESAVTVLGSGLYETTITFNVGEFIIGIEEQNMLSDVKLYPVPSNNTITIESPVDLSRIVISNIVGQVIQTIENPTQLQAISVANYATGVYMVTLFDNNGNSTTQRLIKH